jgi:tRNA(Ile2) C34 agmatinyltransferase TiaS
MLMKHFPRGTLPPSAYVELARGAPKKVDAAPTTLEAAATAEAPRGTCDLASTCPNCNTLMQPEHAHYRCATCGYRDSCCF